MSLPRSGLVLGVVCLFGACCVLFGGLWLVCLSGSGSYLLTPFIEFISGDLCLSAHTAPLPVQKKLAAWGECFAQCIARAEDTRLQAED